MYLEKKILQWAQEVNFYDLMCSWTTTTVFSVGRVSRIKWLATLLPAKSLQSCPTPSNPVDWHWPGSYVPGLLHAHKLAWLPWHPPGELPDPEIEPTSLICHWKACSSLLRAPPGKPACYTPLKHPNDFQKLGMQRIRKLASSNLYCLSPQTSRAFLA